MYRTALCTPGPAKRVGPKHLAQLPRAAATLQRHEGGLAAEGAALVRPFAELEGRPDGAVSADGQVAGTYIHGVFDEPAACHAILAWAGLKTQGE